MQVFSLGYMADEPAPARGRYFGFHSLFVFAMGLLVLAPNMLELFLGWELVGVTSYLLIGFYYQKPSAAQAAVKAFWVTKFADMGLAARHHLAVRRPTGDVQLERHAAGGVGRRRSRSCCSSA